MRKQKIRKQKRNQRFFPIYSEIQNYYQFMFRRVCCIVGLSINSNHAKLS